MVYRRSQSLEEIAQKSKQDIESEFEVKYSLIKTLERMRPNNELLDREHPRYYMECTCYSYSVLHSKVRVPELGKSFHVHANELTSSLDGKKIAIMSSAPNIQYENTWEALYYKNVKLMVMLCQLYDDYIGISTDQYWPR